MIVCHVSLVSIRPLGLRWVCCVSGVSDGSLIYLLDRPFLVFHFQ